MKRFSEIIFCVLKMKEGLTVVERHEDASHFLFLTPNSQDVIRFSGCLGSFVYVHRCLGPKGVQNAS